MSSKKKKTNEGWIQKRSLFSTWGRKLLHSKTVGKEREGKAPFLFICLQFNLIASLFSTGWVDVSQVSSMKSVTYSHQWQCLVDFIEKRFPAVSVWIQTRTSFVLQQHAGGMRGVWKSHFHQYILGWFCVPRGAKGKGGAREERRNTKLVCRGMKVFVCSHRPARASAAPRRASGWQNLHDLLGKCMMCMEGLCCPYNFCIFRSPNLSM